MDLRHPSASGGTLSVLMIGVAFLVLISGLTVLGHSQEKKVAKPAGPKAPTGPAVNTLAVDALPTLSFQAKEFTVPPGVNKIDYVDKGGTHTLLFDQAQLSYFRLAVPEGPTSGKVDLAAGKYTISATFRTPGGGDVGRHRGQGGAPNTGPAEKGGGGEWWGTGRGHGADHRGGRGRLTWAAPVPTCSRGSPGRRSPSPASF